jgi:hypothetical protein
VPFKIGSIIRKLSGNNATTKLPWPDPVPNPNASEFEVDLWTLSRFLIEKVVPVVGTHPYPLNELLLMTGAACRLRPSVVFDWGTHIGASARIFYECGKAFKLGEVALEQWQKLGRPKRPLFFVDGDHAYESVRD